MEAPELIEMEREDEDVVKGVIDYAAGLMSAASSWWSSATGSAEERKLGDSGNFKIMACEERRSSTSKIDTYGEFDLRSVQAMPVNEVANQNEPTPPVLPQLFRLVGQIGHLQAEQAERVEKFEKESEFEYLNDNLSHELEAIKNSVSTMGAMHEKQIEAIDIDNIFIPECQQGGLPVPARIHRSVMRYLFGTHAFDQHHHPHHELCQQSTPPTSSYLPPWPPPSRHSRRLGRHRQTGRLLSEV